MTARRVASPALFLQTLAKRAGKEAADEIDQDRDPERDENARGPDQAGAERERIADRRDEVQPCVFRGRRQDVSSLGGS
jgi:hypothetical protein